MRGYGLTAVQVDYEPLSFSQIIEHLNANTLVVLQIETQRALDAREELLAVAGIDAVMVGPADLSISLGVPGEFQHPKMIAAMEAVCESCVKHGIAPGTQTRSAALARFWKERGMLFLGCSNDSGMLYERATELIAQIRAN
jgi:2-dehydro-3-deoxyglucarate aldolase/4-hydroxy-2-oxoheptanedioate aldolase